MEEEEESFSSEEPLPFPPPVDDDGNGASFTYADSYGNQVTGSFREYMSALGRAANSACQSLDGDGGARITMEGTGNLRARQIRLPRSLLNGRGGMD